MPTASDLYTDGDVLRFLGCKAPLYQLSLVLLTLRKYSGSNNGLVPR